MASGRLTHLKLQTLRFVCLGHLDKCNCEMLALALCNNIMFSAYGGKKQRVQQMELVEVKCKRPELSYSPVLNGCRQQNWFIWSETWTDGKHSINTCSVSVLLWFSSLGHKWAQIWFLLICPSTYYPTYWCVGLIWMQKTPQQTEHVLFLKQKTKCKKISGASLKKNIKSVIEPGWFSLLLELCPWNETSWQSALGLISLNGRFCQVSEPKMKQVNSLVSSLCQVETGWEWINLRRVTVLWPPVNLNSSSTCSILTLLLLSPSFSPTCCPFSARLCCKIKLQRGRQKQIFFSWRYGLLGTQSHIKLSLIIRAKKLKALGLELTDV